MIARVDMRRQASVLDGQFGGLGRDAIARAANLDGSRIELVDEIASTNTELMNRPVAGDPLAPLVLIAARQSGGRGRRGRAWLSETSDCLTMSISMHRARGGSVRPLTGLSLALGAAVATTVASHARGIGLKWPNDLLRDGRKCAGMLVETRAVGEFERVVIGLGLNWSLSPALARSVAGTAAGAGPERPALPPGALLDAPPTQALRELITGELAGAIIDATLAFFEEGFADTASRWARFDVLAGRDVVIHGNGDRALAGRADGLDPDGALRVRTAQGVGPVAAGEVSVRFPQDVVPNGAGR